MRVSYKRKKTGKDANVRFNMKSNASPGSSYNTCWTWKVGISQIKKKKNALALVFKSSISFKNIFLAPRKSWGKEKKLIRKTLSLGDLAEDTFHCPRGFATSMTELKLGIRSVKVYKFFFIKLQINIQLVLTNYQQKHKIIIFYYIIYITIQLFIKRELGI